jgi:hypothetical protein
MMSAKQTAADRVKGAVTRKMRIAVPVAPERAKLCS